MATIFNENTVVAEPDSHGAKRQRLLTEARVPGTGIHLDRLTIGPGGEARLTVNSTSVAWIQVLDGEHDARKRIYLVTPKMFGTKVVKGEMIIYPPGTAAANHHHEGAEHFMYVLRGHGTVYANEKPFAVRKGDVIYYPDLERHYLSLIHISEPTRRTPISYAV